MQRSCSSRARNCRRGFCEEDDEIMQRIGADKSLSRSQILEMTQRLNHPLTYQNLWNYYTLGESDHSFFKRFSPLSTRHLSCFEGHNYPISKGRSAFCSIQEQNEHVQNLTDGQLALNSAPDSNRTLKGKDKELDMVLSYCWNGYWRILNLFVFLVPWHWQTTYNLNSSVIISYQIRIQKENNYKMK